MVINYTIEQIKTNIFSVTLPDSYHLPLLFCRVQEFYESPNENFRGKKFSIWDFMEWYAKSNSNGSFTYPSDWGGFNIPFDVLEECINLNEIESPYDVHMIKIYEFIKTNKTEGKAYIIGSQTNSGQTFEHEVCHGMFYINEEYKEKALKFVKDIDQKIFNRMKKNLLSSGYTEFVIEDEIHAYLMYGYDSPVFSNGVNKKKINELHKNIHQLLK